MPRGIKKEHLPSKICVTCGRPFTWRKKWERCWDEVTTCSKSCNQKRRQQQQQKITKTSDDSTSSENERQRPSTSQSKQYHQSSFSSTGSDEEQQHCNNEDNHVFDYCHAIDDIKMAVNDVEKATVSISTAATTFLHDDNIQAQQHLIPTNDYECTNDDSEGKNDFVNKPINDSMDPLWLTSNPTMVETTVESRQVRKADKKIKKAERRAQREGRGDPNAGSKSCDLCHKPNVHLLIRCMHRAGQTDWSMVCGKCWHEVSGGVPDGDAHHPHYRYGGLWKNRRRQSPTAY